MMSYILKPANALTAASLFCGLYSVMWSAGAEAGDSRAFFWSALLIIFAGIFDGLDGRVARLTHTESEFGVQLDSLVDVVSFGVAPGVLLYKWGLDAYGSFGLVVAFLFTLCGAFRLARFNLKAASEEGAGKDKRYSEGLTITCAGGMVSALVLHHSKVRATEVDNTLAVLLLTLMLSYLMISTVRFRSWRSLRISPASVVLLAVSMAAAVVILAVYDVTMLLVAIGGGYIGFGLLEEAFHLTRRRRDDDLYYLSESPVPDGEEGAEDEEEEARA